MRVRFSVHWKLSVVDVKPSPMLCWNRITFPRLPLTQRQPVLLRFIGHSRRHDKVLLREIIHSFGLLAGLLQAPHLKLRLSWSLAPLNDFFWQTKRKTRPMEDEKIEKISAAYVVVVIVHVRIVRAHLRLLHFNHPVLLAFRHPTRHFLVVLIVGVHLRDVALMSRRALAHHGTIHLLLWSAMSVRPDIRILKKETRTVLSRGIRSFLDPPGSHPRGAIFPPVD